MCRLSLLRNIPVKFKETIALNAATAAITNWHIMANMLVD